MTPGRPDVPPESADSDDPSPTVTPSDARTEELRANLGQVRARIATACTAAGRDPATVTLVVVTKTHPAADVRRLAALGVTDVGENRDQEAGPKHDECRDLALRWHFVGQLQTNKAASVARYADVVESVDRPALVAALARGARRADRHLDVLLQVSLDGAAGRGGAAIDAIPALADSVAAEHRLRLRGVMAVAPLGADPVAAFRRLAEVAARLRERHPRAIMMSAGMSHDLEAAVAAGATHVRIGTAVLGERPVLG